MTPKEKAALEAIGNALEGLDAVRAMGLCCMVLTTLWAEHGGRSRALLERTHKLIEEFAGLEDKRAAS